MKNIYEVIDLKTNKVKITVSGEHNQTYVVDTYAFHQQLGTFLNADDQYRIDWLKNNTEV